MRSVSLLASGLIVLVGRLTWKLCRDLSGSADGCVIAFEYVGQLREEEEAKFSDREKAQAQNVTIVTQPAAAYGQPQPYPFAAPQNSYGPEYKEEPL